MTEPAPAGSVPAGAAPAGSVPAASQSVDAVVCGAGIAGIAVAHALAVVQGMRQVVVVDAVAPMSLTSDKSTEAYRNWWPGPDAGMLHFMNRNIDLLESLAHRLDNRILLNRRGYFYVTADADVVCRYQQLGKLAEQQGAGTFRSFTGEADASAPSSAYRRAPSRGLAEAHEDASVSGADLITDRQLIRTIWPSLSTDALAVLHARRCGWLSGQQLGASLLEECRAAGVRVIEGRVVAVDSERRVEHVDIVGPGGALRIATPVFVNAAGPYARDVGRFVGADLPIFSELHCKLSFEDTLGVIDRDAGLTILDDEQRLHWSDEERAELVDDASLRWLTETMPAGIHFRPEGYHGSRTVLMLWDYHRGRRFEAPVLPIATDPLFPEVVMRGMTRLVPALSPYVERLPRTVVDGGYYTKTAENRPLIGPLERPGAYVCAAFSGFGLMAALGAGELLAAHITKGPLPAYAPAFTPDRYTRPAYRAMLDRWGDVGQL